MVLEDLGEFCLVDDDDIEDNFLFFAGVCAIELGIFGIAISCFIAEAGTSCGSDSFSR